MQVLIQISDNILNDVKSSFLAFYLFANTNLLSGNLTRLRRR